MVDSRVSTLSPFPLLALLILAFSFGTSSLKVSSPSPCQPVCDTSLVGTIADDIVCLDSQYGSTTNGSHFQRCVDCELGSNAVESSSGATDVTWGLYNLRYAFSTCVFGFPIEKISLSTPCQVSCSPLQDAILHSLDSNVTVEDLSFCNLPSFQDTVGINRCAECYGRMDRQAYMANFLQALHIACLDPPRPSETFPVIGGDIFSSAAIPTPTPSPTDKPSAGKPANLALIIALPVVFGVLIIAGVVVCCFYSARRRRRMMAERNNMRAIHDKASPTYAHNDQQYYHAGQIQSPTTQYQSPPSAHPSFFSPMPDSKDNPYPQLQSPVAQDQKLAPFSQHISPETTGTPYHSSYAPADYAKNLHNPQQQQLRPLDTSQVGPGPDQSKVHSLHDQYFPLPPPPSHLPPPAASTQMPMPMPPPPPQPQLQEGGVEPLSQHQKKTPSLARPVPRKKKTLDQQQQQQQQHSSNEESGDGIQLQEYAVSGEAGGENDENDDRGARPVPQPSLAHQHENDRSSPAQVFVYDPFQGKYVKESQPDARSQAEGGV